MNVMGLTERHWFENDDPKLTDRQLEDIIYENKRAYDSGYVKGYSDRCNEIVLCRDCKHKNNSLYCPIALLYEIVMKTKVFDFKVSDDWFCADGERKE